MEQLQKQPVPRPKSRAFWESPAGAVLKEQFRRERLGHKANATQLTGLNAGRAAQLERFQRERREWDAIALRVNGASLIEIADKLGFGKSRKRVRTAVRSVDLPEGKRYTCDRGQPFTRGSGINLYKALNQTAADFATLVSTAAHPVRERRIMIWFTNRQKNLMPIETQACTNLRDRIARALLAQDGKRGRDSYDRREILAALFPRFREEYKTLGLSLRGIGALLKENPSAKESEISAFVIQRAKDEVKGELSTTCYRELIRWLPQLMPTIIAHRAAIRGTKAPHRVAFEILAETMGAPTKIVRDAIEEQIKPASPDKMRFILRSFPEFVQTAPALSPKILAPTGGRKKGQLTDDTKNLILLAAAYERLGETKVYAIAPKLYPLSDRRSRDAAEAATRLFRKRNRKQINDVLDRLDVAKAADIVAAIHPKS
jgi:hypothetical protein